MDECKIKNFPQEIINKIVLRQVEQGNNADLSIFDANIYVGKKGGGFDWGDTKEGHDFWYDVIIRNNYKRFFKMYPRNKSIWF